jgi:hypothetical protein
MVTSESVLVIVFTHAEYLTVGALEDATLAMAIPAPTSATAPVVAMTLFQSFITFPVFPVVRGSIERRAMRPGYWTPRKVQL